MKVLLVSPLPPPSGGMARWTQLFNEGCKLSDIDVKVINTSISNKRAEQKDRKFLFGDEVRRAYRILKELKFEKANYAPDIIHICSPCSRVGLFRDYFCMRLAKETPVVFHCHCNIEDQARTAISKVILNKIIYMSKKVFVLNLSSKKFVDAFVKNKAVLMPNFIQEKKEETEYKVRENIHKIIYVGHVKKRKGIKEIYQVAHKFPKIEFEVAGPVQETPEDIQKPLNVNLLGEIRHDDVVKKLNDSDIFFFPSYTEGFANVMLEAMSVGIPIIATDVGANKDMIEDCGGIIVPVGDVEAMSQAIFELKSKEKRKKMSIWNIDKVKGAYSLDKVMKKIKLQYEEILK